MGESGWEKLGRGWAANKSKDAVANFRNASVERRSREGNSIGGKERRKDLEGIRIIFAGRILESRTRGDKCKKEKLVDG